VYSIAGIVAQPQPEWAVSLRVRDWGHSHFFPSNIEEEYRPRMAFVMPIVIIGVVLLAAPQIVIGVVILAAAVGISAAVGKVVFAIIGHPTVR
jgi:hypothetical protein